MKNSTHTKNTIKIGDKFTILTDGRYKRLHNMYYSRFYNLEIEITDIVEITTEYPFGVITSTQIIFNENFDTDQKSSYQLDIEEFLKLINENIIQK